MTYMKKLALLAGSALLALAFAIPATASAYTEWTLEGETFPEATGWETFEGPFTFYYNQPNTGGFTCDTEIEIEVNREYEETKANIVRFDRDAASCVGTGLWQGCAAKSLTSNHAGGWGIAMGSPPAVTSPSGFIEIAALYEKAKGSGFCGMYGTTAKFEPILSFVPTLNGKGRLASLTLQGTTTNGLSQTYGPFVATGVGGEQLGLE